MGLYLAGGLITEMKNLFQIWWAYNWGGLQPGFYGIVCVCVYIYIYIYRHTKMCNGFLKIFKGSMIKFHDVNALFLAFFEKSALEVYPTRPWSDIFQYCTFTNQKIFFSKRNQGLLSMFIPDLWYHICKILKIHCLSQVQKSHLSKGISLDLYIFIWRQILFTNNLYCRRVITSTAKYYVTKTEMQSLRIKFKTWFAFHS